MRTRPRARKAELALSGALRPRGTTRLQRTVCVAALICLICLTAVPAAALVQSNPFLEAAFSMLEEGNLFLTQYDELGQNLAEARFPLGLPYFFAGYNENIILRPRQPTQTSNYFVADHRYLYGFDCVGFTRWVQREAGVDEHDTLSNLLYECRNDQILEGRNASEWPTFFKVGDFLVVDHGWNHILMYIGTPTDYGLNAVNAPEIAHYLDYPLMIHCGYNPFYMDRYAAYIEQMGYRNTRPPDGGVTVSLLGMERAYHSRTDDGNVFEYFIVMGQPLPVFSLENCTRMAWIPQID